MLAKLMKYDLKKMGRILIIMYIISLALAGITRLINIGKEIQAVAIIGGIFAGFTYSAIGTVLVNTFVHILRAFIVNFYKDESYLTHTLPVNKGKLLLSKYLSSLIVILCSVLVCFLSLFILFYSPEFMQGLKFVLEASISGFNIPLWLFLTLMVVLIFAQICATLSMAFASIIIANKYNHKRVLKGLLWFGLFYLSVMVDIIVTAVIVFAIQGNMAELLASQLSSSAFTTILVLGLIIYVLYAVLFYFISLKKFNKGVNVD